MTLPENALLVWLDIETSGLTPADDWLLEIGAVFTTPDLEPICDFGLVAALPDAWDPDNPDDWPIEDVVRDMHTRNSLLADSLAERRVGSVYTEETVVDRFLDAVTDFTREKGRLPVAAGSGVAEFDVPWLRHLADPRREWPFHYRSLDISPVRAMLTVAGIDIATDASSGPGKAHRALLDAWAHLEEARLIRDTLQRMKTADRNLAAQIDNQDGPWAHPAGGEL